MGTEFRYGKAGVFVLALLPALYLLSAALNDSLGANPAETLIRSTGDWVLRFLCLALAVTPFRVHLAWPALARYRRMLGLYCFFYAVLHLLAFAGLDMGFDMQAIGRDIAKRPFILVGFCTFCILLVLAATSWNGAIRRLGGRRWQALHRTVYLAALLAILHFFWMRAGKNNFTEVWWYAVALSLLLGDRILRYGMKSRSGP